VRPGCPGCLTDELCGESGVRAAAVAMFLNDVTSRARVWGASCQIVVRVAVDVSREDTWRWARPLTEAAHKDERPGRLITWME